jgi:hypothetical protein
MLSSFRAGKKEKESSGSDEMMRKKEEPLNDFGTRFKQNIMLSFF